MKKITTPNIAFATPRLASPWRWTSNRSRPSLIIVASISAVLNIDFAQAEAWTIEPSASIKSTHTDNFRLQTENVESVTGANVSAGVKVALETENTSVSAAPSVQINRYTSDGDYDTNYAFLEFGSKYKDERSEYGLDVGYARDSSIISESETTGLTERNIDRDAVKVTPKYSYRLTERATVGITYEQSDVSYENIPNSGLRDYENKTLTGSLGYRLTEIDDLRFALSRSQYEARAIAQDYTTLRAQVGITRRFSELVSGNASIGGRVTEREFLLNGQPETEDTSGYTLGLGVVARLVQGDLSIQALRDLIPTGAGTLSEQNSLRSTLNHRFDERLTGTVSATLISNRNPGSESVSENRDYIDVRTGLDWRWTPELSVVGGYRYRWRKSDIGDSDATGNEVDVGISYRGAKTNL